MTNENVHHINDTNIIDVTNENIHQINKNIIIDVTNVLRRTVA